MSGPDLFEYADEAPASTPGGLVVTLPSGLGTKAELLEALRLALALPDYFEETGMRSTRYCETSGDS